MQSLEHLSGWDGLVWLCWFGCTGPVVQVHLSSYVGLILLVLFHWSSSVGSVVPVQLFSSSSMVRLRQYGCVASRVQWSQKMGNSGSTFLGKRTSMNTRIQVQRDRCTFTRTTRLLSVSHNFEFPRSPTRLFSQSLFKTAKHGRQTVF